MTVRTQPMREKIDPIMEMILRAVSAADCRPVILISYRKSGDGV